MPCWINQLWRRDSNQTASDKPGAVHNGIVERFHKTVLDEFYRIAFRKKIYQTIVDLQADLDAWITQYNEARSHQGRYCFGKTPLQTFLDASPVAREKSLLDLDPVHPTVD